VFHYRCVMYEQGCGYRLAWPLQRKRALVHSSACELLPRFQRDCAIESLAGDSVAARLDKIAARALTGSPGNIGTGVINAVSTDEAPRAHRPTVVPLDVSARKAADEQLNLQLKDALVEWIAESGIPPNAFDRDGFKRFCKIAVPRWKPPSGTTLAQSLIPAQAAYFKQETIALLRTNLTRLTISFDAGTMRQQQSNISVHVMEEDGTKHLVALVDGADASHTGEYYVQLLDEVRPSLLDLNTTDHRTLQVMTAIGPDRFVAVASDSTGNTSKARRVLKSKYPWIAIIPDPCHRLNALCKHVGGMKTFKPVSSSSCFRSVGSLQISDFEEDEAESQVLQKVAQGRLASQAEAPDDANLARASVRWENALRNKLSFGRVARALHAGARGTCQGGQRPDHGTVFLV
jgi:hypothetical protein